jgi:serine/threonine protein kinase
VQDFEILRVIGKGGFSTVYEVLNKLDGKRYAMKCMKKEKIIKEGKMQHVMNERTILESLRQDNEALCDHCKADKPQPPPFIVQMKWAFQTVSPTSLFITFSIFRSITF